MFLDDASTLVQLNDLAVDMPSERIFKDSGAMIAPCTIAQVGIMSYRAKECGALFADRDPESIVRVATLEEDLFCEDSLESYRAAPITVGHPATLVDTNNAKDLQKGNLDGVPFADGAMLSGTIVLNDAETIALVDNGTTKLSSGQHCNLVLVDHADYDAKKTDIRANHIAIVEQGRASGATIADEDISYTQVQLDDAVKEAEDKVTATMQDSIDTLQAELDASKEKVTLGDAALVAEKAKFDDAAIDAMVTARLKFVQSVELLTDTDITGMTELEAKKAVVTELLDTDVSTKGDAYIEARFDVLLEDVDTDSPMTNELRKQTTVVLDNKVVQEPSKADIARQNMINRSKVK